VIHLRSDVERLCSPLRDVLIAEAFLAARFGMHRHHRYWPESEFAGWSH